MKIKRYLQLSTLALVALFLYACTENDSETMDESQNSTFDRSAILLNWADNIIVPAYTDFETKTNTLQIASQTFVDAPSLVTLEALQAAWFQAYLGFQSVSIFETGKGEELSYRNRLNAYPTSVSKINTFIENGDYNLVLPSTFDAQGFPALDYLLYGLGENNDETLTYFTTRANAEGYRQLLNAVSQSIHSLTQEVLESWTSTFRDGFVANTDSSVNGSVDRLTNDFIFYYEKALRAGKVGIPAGIFSNDPLPQNVEAFYKGDISKELLIAAIQTTQDFFNGKHYNSATVGIGFKDYLVALNSVKNGEDLSLLINNQFNLSKVAASNLNDNFSLQINEDNNTMLEAYNQLQRNVVFMKVDMLQALSIEVDFVDTDGD